MKNLRSVILDMIRTRGIVRIVWDYCKVHCRELPDSSTLPHSNRSGGASMGETLLLPNLKLFVGGEAGSFAESRR